jgi:hypothetical protein
MDRQGRPLAWEQEMSLGSWARTWLRLLASPKEAFSAEPGADWRVHLIFAAGVNLAVAIGVWLWFTAGHQDPGQLGLRPGPSEPGHLGLRLALLFLLGLVHMTFQAGLVTLLVKFISKAEAGMGVAFRAACYAQAPRAVTILTPVVGPIMELVFFVWNLALMVIGLAKGYQMAWGRSVAVNVIYAVLSLYLSVVFA